MYISGENAQYGICEMYLIGDHSDISSTQQHSLLSGS